MEKNQRIELLKDVFTLIHPELVGSASPQMEKENEERKLRVQTWLSDIVHATSHEENPWRNQEKSTGGPLNLLPQFMHLLRECILTHQWTQVLSMLKCISHLPYGADWATWKATQTALYTEPESNVSLIQEFFKQSYLLKECNVRDVALEFVQYLISQGLTQEASQVIQTARKARPGGKSEYQRDLTQHAMNLLDGYQGLAFYMDWKAAINKQLESSQITPSQSFYSLTSSQGPSDEAVKSIAKRATLGLDSLLQKSGVWDIFLTKSVEIHEFYGEHDSAKDLLCKYRDRNPDNPNAHRFLYEYLTRNCACFDEEFVNKESVCCLKSLAKLDPANPLVLTLWQKLRDGGGNDQALHYVFDLLDYEIWREKDEGWQCLAKSLGTGFSKEKRQEEKTAFLTVLASCWSSRKDWWPEYHFMGSTATNTDQSSSDQLLSSKIIVATVLIGKDCHFNTEARKVLNISSHQLLDNVLSDLDWDTVTEFTEQHGCPATHPSWTRTRQSKRLSCVSASFLSDSHTATHAPSSSSRRQRKVGKGSSSFTNADTPCSGSSEVRNSPLTRSGNFASTFQKRISPSGDVVSPDEGHSSSSISSVDLSSSGSADLSSSKLSSDEDCGTAGDSHRLGLRKRKRKHTNEKSSTFTNLDKSDVVSKLDTYENAANSSSHRKKRKRRAEDVDDQHFNLVKRRRTEN